MRYKNIFYCCTESIKNIRNIKDYLIENTDRLITFHYHLGYSNEFSYLEVYEKGKLKQKKTLSLYKGNNVLIKNLFYFLYFSYIMFSQVRRGSFILSYSPIFCFGRHFFKVVKGVNYIFWIGDYFPEHNFPMNLYHWLVNHYNKTADFVLYISPPLKKIYSPSRKKGFKKLVPLGIKYAPIKTRHKSNNKITAGYVGVIRKQQGLDLFFRYLEKNTGISLTIVGDGYHKKFYETLAKKLKIQKNIKFLGHIENLEKVISTWSFGIALYEDTPTNLSVYCEPTKLKTYFSFGLPVITTSATYFAEEVKNFSAGIVVQEKPSSVAAAVRRLTNNYEKYMKGVKKILYKYQYEDWYNEHLNFMSGRSTEPINK